MDRTGIDEATGRDDIDGWDSVSLPGLLLALEDALGVELPPEEAVEVETLAELARLAHRQAAAR
jgi:acyl carrier protein